MNVITIRYCFKLDGNKQEIIELQLDPQSLEVRNKPVQQLPDWTRLDFHQCSHCPLETTRHPRCPVAVSLVDVVSRFDKLLSYDQVDLEVVTAERRISQRATAQRAISSLLGLLFATSGCPHTAFFRPMARFHLPMAMEDDTIYRATGMYLLAQYFLKKDGKEDDADLKGLAQIYSNLRLLNRSIADRLRGATHTDSSLNAIVVLDMLASAVPFVIEEQLEDVRHLFAPYFSEYYNSLVINPARSR